ncbi:MAG: RIP metalloprotease RseP [Paracoccaceae bacterium]
MDLLPQFGSAAFTLAAFVVALSVIVAVHEYGHYIVGRWSGIHAEVFSIGFGPVLAKRTDRRGTQWQIAALPLGGYVRFKGDANAASVGADGRAGRDTMPGAPLWARAATVAAGPLFNFALALVVFVAAILVQGQARDPLTVAAVPDLPASYGAGLRAGDVVLGIDGREGADLAAFSALVGDLPARRSLDWSVSRDGARLTVPGPHPYPPLVSSVAPDGAARDAGIRAGDVIVAADGVPLATFGELRIAVADASGPVSLTVWRDGAATDVPLTPRRVDVPVAGGGFESRTMVGVTGGLVFEPAVERPGPLSAIALAAGQVWFIISSSISGLWHMITGAISSCNLSGPVGIAQASGAMASDGAGSFVRFIAVLSVAVGLLNLFPIPVLDGGHLVFHAYEAVTGRPPGPRALNLLMALGLSLLLTLMLFALANDLFLCP